VPSDQGGRNRRTDSGRRGVSHGASDHKTAKAPDVYSIARLKSVTVKDLARRLHGGGLFLSAFADTVRTPICGHKKDPFDLPQLIGFV
jgi:hypothetical protein